MESTFSCGSIRCILGCGVHGGSINSIFAAKIDIFLSLSLYPTVSEREHWARLNFQREFSILLDLGSEIYDYDGYQLELMKPSTKKEKEKYLQQKKEKKNASNASVL